MLRAVNRYLPSIAEEWLKRSIPLKGDILLQPVRSMSQNGLNADADQLEIFRGTRIQWQARVYDLIKHL